MLEITVNKESLLEFHFQGMHVSADAAERYIDPIFMTIATTERVIVWSESILDDPCWAAVYAHEEAHTQLGHRVAQSLTWEAFPMARDNELKADAVAIKKGHVDALITLLERLLDTPMIRKGSIVEAITQARLDQAKQAKFDADKAAYEARRFELLGALSSGSSFSRLFSVMKGYTLAFANVMRNA
jgi:hypothetical protein